MKISHLHPFDRAQAFQPAAQGKLRAAAVLKLWRAKVTSTKVEGAKSLKVEKNNHKYFITKTRNEESTKIIVSLQPFAS